MDYVCDHMKRTVVYDQDRLSITLTRCGECIGCYRIKIEMPGQSCTAPEDLGKLPARPGFEGVKVIIERLRK